MKGALNENGTMQRNGLLRDHPCHAGTHVYPEGNPEKLLVSLSLIVEDYNIATKDNTSSLVIPAARLFYETVTLHPFENGNGRLCRLLYSFGIMQAGIPFPAILSTGHSKAHEHNMRAILCARNGDFRELATISLMSVQYSLSNFFENAKHFNVK